MASAAATATAAPPPPYGSAGCSCCTWKAVQLAPLGRHAGEPQRVDRLGVLTSQLSLGSVPRPLNAVAPAPTAAGDGGVLINTVLGEVSTTQLGWTSSHEHIFANDAKSSIIAHQYPEAFPRDYIVEEGTAALKLFKAAGGGTMVDCTTVDLGRDIRLMEEVALASGVNIVATTGCWIDVPLAWQKSDPDALAALYVRDCTVGIEGTNIKAGIIKCARARQLPYSYPSCKRSAAGPDRCRP